MIYREAGQFRTSYAADQALFPIRQDRLFVLAVAILAFGVVPFLASEYLLRAILIPFLILAIAAIGLNLLVGYCGQISLGSAAFMAVGAYGSYDIALHFPWHNLIVVFVLGGLCAAAAGIDLDQQSELGVERFGARHNRRHHGDVVGQQLHAGACGL